MAAMTSCIGLSPQAPRMERVNSSPNESEPWKLTETTTYPAAANTWVFQRQCHDPPEALWGPPWMLCTNGHFCLRSKPGG